MKNTNTKEQKEKYFDLFDRVWADTVIPTIKEFGDKYRKFVYFNKLSKLKAKKCFHKEAQTFVHSYMVNETKNIDRHKIASCMLKAILVAKPFKCSFLQKTTQFFKREKIDDECSLINQYIALNVAVLILEGYIASDKNKEIKHRIYTPEPFKGNKDYLKDVCLDLYYTKPRRINTITYANIFFLWEKYSCRKVQCNNLETLLMSCLDGSDEEKQKKIHDTKMSS